MIIAKNKVVQIHYTLTNDEKDILDSSVGREPLAFIQGIGNIIPGLEKAIEGKVVGEKLQVSIEPEEAYGVPNQDLTQTVSKAIFQDQEKVEVGAQFQIQGPEGDMIGRISKIEDDNVTIDLNHPLAGVRLHFDVEIVSIRDASNEELDHEHAHGIGGHQH